MSYGTDQFYGNNRRLDPGLRNSSHGTLEMAERLCLFCKQGISDRDKVGETFHKDDITVHQYCLVFPSDVL